MFYVAMTDKFMSGWGPARGRTNRLVVVCNTYDQAAQIARAARQRSDMKRVAVRRTKPYYNIDRVLTSWKHYSDLGGSWKEA